MAILSRLPLGVFVLSDTRNSPAKSRVAAAWPCHSRTENEMELR